MDLSKIEFSVRVQGNHPKDRQLIISCIKGELYFDFESNKLSFPKNFEEHCKEVGAIWAIRYEKEISKLVAPYIS